MTKAGLLSGLGIIAVAWAQPALAQTAPAPSDAEEKGDETIVVTGYRGVTAPVASIKQNAVAVVDTLTQKEIETLPDRSLAEVLDRVVGVSSDRGFNASQARTVTLRGFDARYNSMDVDGNLIWNSSRNNRGTQLDVFPAATISQIDVFKTVTPDMDANSIGGHLSLRTLRAFDGGTKSYIKASAAYGINEQNALPDEGRPTFRADAVGKFTFGPERQFGVVLGGEYQQIELFDRYDEVTAYSLVNGVDVLNGNIFGGIFQQKQERAALLGKLEYRAIDQTYAFLSASWFNNTLFQTFNRGGIFSAANRVTGAAPGTGAFTNATGETFYEDYTLDRETILIGTGIDTRIGAAAALSLRAGYTRYNHDEAFFRSERFQVTGLNGSYDLTDNGIAASFAPDSLARLADPVNWRSRSNRAAFDQPIPHRDDVLNASLDLNVNAQNTAEGWGLRAGVFWRQLDRDFDQTTINFLIPNGTIFLLSDALDPRLAPQAITGLNPPFIDRDGYRDFLGRVGVVTTNDAVTTDYRLTEDVYAGHAAVRFATGSFSILAGARLESTSFVNDTQSTTSGVTAPETRTKTYTEFLPNVQIALDPAPGLRLRAAFTETIARPDFADFANGVTVSVNTQGAQVISGANPQLDPRKSRNYDLSAEYYFGDGGYIALGLFRKELKNETFRQIRNTLDGNGVITLIETIPLNTGSASLDGLEISFVKERLDFLPGALANLGFSGNYTLLDGEWNVVLTDGTQRSVSGLRNQPNWLANARLSYTQDRFSANLAYRWRGKTFANFGATPDQDIFVDRYVRLDAQASFQLLPQLQLFAEARNITNSDWREFSGATGDALRLTTTPGRSYWFGAKWKM